MFDKVKTFLYSQVYINIIAQTKNTTIYIEEVFFKGESKQKHEVIETAKKEKIDEYIQKAVKKSPIFYITLLDTSPSQGAIPTCNSKKMAEFCDMSISKHICYSEQWGYYTSQLDLLSYQKQYAKVGVDFIFSPFLLLVKFFKDKIEGDMTLYILLNADSMSLGVFAHNELLYAEHIDMENENSFDDELLVTDEPLDEELELDDEASVNLEDVDVMDDIDSLEVFDDIEDLDSFDDMGDIEDFSEENIADEDSATPQEESFDDDSGFGDEYHRFSLIQSSIKQFYNDDRFPSDFLENVYIADGIGTRGDLKKFLEEEMFLNVYIRKLDLGMELCELAKGELQ